MTAPLRTEPFYQKLEAEHRDWLSSFDQRHLSNWERLLKNDVEAPFAEARVRQLLHGYGVVVEPSEDLNTRKSRPDFRCIAGEYKFYVEVTNISIDSASSKTGLPAQDDGEVRTFSRRKLAEKVFSKCQKKVTKYPSLDAPLLVAIGTFHTDVGVLCFDDLSFVNQLLTGEVITTFPIDIRTAKPAGRDRCTTKLNSAVFLRPDKIQEVDYARSSISGLLLCNLGLKIPTVIGILHPNPIVPFDPAVLPNVGFRQVRLARASGQMQVAWACENGKEVSSKTK